MGLVSGETIRTDDVAGRLFEGLGDGPRTPDR